MKFLLGIIVSAIVQPIFSQEPMSHKLGKCILDQTLRNKLMEYSVTVTVDIPDTKQVVAELIKLPPLELTDLVKDFIQQLVDNTNILKESLNSTQHNVNFLVWDRYTISLSKHYAPRFILAQRISTLNILNRILKYAEDFYGTTVITDDKLRSNLAKIFLSQEDMSKKVNINASWIENLSKSAIDNFNDTMYKALEEFIQNTSHHLNNEIVHGTPSKILRYILFTINQQLNKGLLDYTSNPDILRESIKNVHSNLENENLFIRMLSRLSKLSYKNDSDAISYKTFVKLYATLDHYADLLNKSLDMSLADSFTVLRNVEKVYTIKGFIWRIVRTIHLDDKITKEELLKSMSEYLNKNISKSYIVTALYELLYKTFAIKIDRKMTRTTSVIPKPLPEDPKFNGLLPSFSVPIFTICGKNLFHLMLTLSAI